MIHHVYLLCSIVVIKMNFITVLHENLIIEIIENERKTKKKHSDTFWVLLLEIKLTLSERK